MNKEARPFEEYKEMIQDMSKDNMIKGLYDLSANIIEKDKEIEEYKEIEKSLNKECNEKGKEIKKLNNIIDELEKHLLEYLDEWQDDEDDFVKGRCLMARDVIHDIYELKEGK